MSLVPSLLNAILRLDGEALVMHVGEKPYVVAPSGQVELASRPLNFDAVSGMVSQLLPVELQRALDEFGAVQYEFPKLDEFQGEHFSVVAARGGEDVWVEVRRRRLADDDSVPDEFFTPASPEGEVAAPERDEFEWRPQDEAVAHVPPATAKPFVEVASAVASAAAESERTDEDFSLPAAEQLWTGTTPSAEPDIEPLLEPEAEPVSDHALETVETTSSIGDDAEQASASVDLGAETLLEPDEEEPTPVVPTVQAHTPAMPPVHEIAARTESEAAELHVQVPAASDAEQPLPPPAAAPPPAAVWPAAAEPGRAEVPAAPTATEPIPEETAVPEPQAPPVMREETPVEPPQPTVQPPQIAQPLSEHRTETPTFAQVEPSRQAPSEAADESEETPAPLAAVTGFTRLSPQPGVVVPLSRSSIRAEGPATGSATATGLDRLLRLAATRGASTLYLTSGARPSIRVDGEIQQLTGEMALSPSEVESLLIDLMPERNREQLRRGIATEWICDVAEVGRLRCMTFRDHRGAGGIIRMMPLHAISADQLGLTREIRALAAEPEGLVLVVGPRSSGKSTLMSAFVDLINRTRRDHVITIETEIKIVHEQRTSLVSQREVHGSTEDMVTMAHSAIRENPDVLVIEELRSAEMMTVALEAAGSGHLVIGALPAHTATDAVDRIIDLYPPEQRRHVQLSLAEALRGIVAQVLVRKPAGGRVAAREVLLNTPAVAGAIAEGKTSQLPAALEAGRKYGMVPLNDALVHLVQNGFVDAREGYRRAADRAGFLTLLKRQGIDTSFVERLA